MSGKFCKQLCSILLLLFFFFPPAFSSAELKGSTASPEPEFSSAGGLFIKRQR